MATPTRAAGEAPATADTTEYPALYLAAEEASRRGRRNLSWLAAGDIFFSLVAALLALLAGLIPAASGATRPTPIDIVLAATAVPFVVSVTLKLFSLAGGFEADWYTGRAVAEAVKSMTWRYQMGAAPYHGTHADATFAGDITRMLHRSNLRQAVNTLTNLPLQITDQMRSSRAQEAGARLDRYVRERLMNQAAWYQARSLENRRNANTWFWLSVVLQLAAVATAIIALALGADANRGSDLLRVMAIFATISLAGTAWNERSRFAQLADSYATTLQELLLAASLARTTDENDSLEQAVKEGEDAILREHRVWLARRVSLVEAD